MLTCDPCGKLYTPNLPLKRTSTPTSSVQDFLRKLAHRSSCVLHRLCVNTEFHIALKFLRTWSYRGVASGVFRVSQTLEATSIWCPSPLKHRCTWPKELSKQNVPFFRFVSLVLLFNPHLIYPFPMSIQQPTFYSSGKWHCNRTALQI